VGNSYKKPKATKKNKVGGSKTMQKPKKNLNKLNTPTIGVTPNG